MTSLHKKIGMCVRVQVRIRLADSGRDLTTPQVMCFQFFLYFILRARKRAWKSPKPSEITIEMNESTL